MKKAIGLVVVVLFFATLSGVSFGEESSEVKEPMSSKYMKEKGQMHGMMMKKMMMGKEMVATKDGGVIVLIGNKLLKYDKDLNLVKEVEIKMDMEGMAEKMTERMEMMEKQGMSEESE